ncbi:hypothetical protein [Marinobacter sp.]|uniref:hypothetical protein n=1 Tax=Marinobacter sp. TaxID=50741 RepID=UPI00356B1070
MMVNVYNAKFSCSLMVKHMGRAMSSVSVKDDKGSEASMMFKNAEDMRYLADRLLDEAVKLELAQAGSEKPAEEVA